MLVQWSAAALWDATASLLWSLDPLMRRCKRPVEVRERPVEVQDTRPGRPQLAFGRVSCGGVLLVLWYAALWDATASLRWNLDLLMWQCERPAEVQEGLVVLLHVFHRKSLGFHWRERRRRARRVVLHPGRATGNPPRRSGLCPTLIMLSRFWGDSFFIG